MNVRIIFICLYTRRLQGFCQDTCNIVRDGYLIKFLFINKIYILTGEPSNSVNLVVTS